MSIGKYLSGSAAPVEKTRAQQTARQWRESGYNNWRAGDAQREKDLPLGGNAPIREDRDNAPPSRPLKPLKKTLGQRIGEKD
jgi:hypothetical protein